MALLCPIASTSGQFCQIASKPASSLHTLLPTGHTVRTMLASSHCFHSLRRMVHWHQITILGYRMVESMLEYGDLIESHVPALLNMVTLTSLHFS